MSRHLPRYLRTLRLQWGLSQIELAHLLGISDSLLSKVESGARQPTARVILPTEILFGLAGEEIFPGAYRAIEKDLADRGRKLRMRLKLRSDWGAEEKKRLLKAMVKRVEHSKESV